MPRIINTVRKITAFIATMKVLILALLLGVSKGGASLLDVLISHPHEIGGLQPTDFNISVARYNSFQLRSIYNEPTFILVALPSSGPDQKLLAYYTRNGLRSVAGEPNFRPLHQFLLNTPRLSGLTYPGGGSNFLSLLSTHVQDVIIASNSNVLDLVQGTEYHYIAFIYIAPSEIFNLHHFRGLRSVGTFDVSPHSIDAVWSDDPSVRASPRPPPGFPFNDGGALFPPGPPVFPHQFRGYR